MVRVAIIDSGVYASHPHVGGRVTGFSIEAGGCRGPDFVDRIGHGTAVAAAIREKAADAAIVAIKVFADSLRTDAKTLARAIREAVLDGAQVINLSLGTMGSHHAATFAPAIDEARSRGAFVVAARDSGDTQWLPGSMEGVIGVRVDWTCPRTTYRIDDVDGRPVIVASGFPREIPGVPRERNLRGLSFAVANATGFVAQAIADERITDIGVLMTKLRVRTAPDRQFETGSTC